MKALLQSLLISNGPELQVQVPKMKLLYILFGANPGTPISPAVFSGGHQKLTESKLTALITSILSMQDQKPTLQCLFPI